MKKRTLCCALVAVVAFAVAGAKSASAQCQYELTTFESPIDCGFFGSDIGVFAINDFGQAVGYVEQCNTHWRPFLWTEELGVVLLPFPPGETRGQAVGINNVLGEDGIGQIICNMGLLGGSTQQAYLYDDGVWINLGVLPGFTSSTANTISDKSEIVGKSGGNFSKAWLWHKGVLTALELPYGEFADALDITNESTTVGWMGEFIVLDAHVFRLSDGTVDDLGNLLGGPGASGRFVDTQGNIGAHAFTPNGLGGFTPHAMRVEETLVLDLAASVGLDISSIGTMNDLGQVIFTANNIEKTIAGAFLWQHGETVDLADLIELPPGTTFLLPSASNARGQFASAVVTNDTATFFGAVWTPVDRPLGDVNCDCAVNELDIIDVIQDWGPCDALGETPSDIVTNATFQPPGDGMVDGADLAVVLGDWTDSVSQPSNQRSRK